MSILALPDAPTGCCCLGFNLSTADSTNIRLFNHPLILTEYLSLTLVPLGFIPEVNEVLNAFFSHALDMR